ncbi:ATP-binding cassette domain-containing protein [Gemella haemolysans]|uniref:Oligopeptide ABC transporter, ATP-binding protein OppF n=1 Tax=Gemella haemolysans ATCC 10379 TaxID=546270 RepID=C5NW17_9BACL|nr:ATP-binding cassette domain-containing protein [Gemella haemolysans]EER68561.1 oligopeptide ABC transporter, ATP-binding protein OppF [Gemella haemolysans ATCC 10379]KAA8708249.1 ABC transporter ATP-binding protein [Gemella haemolysans]UBH82457.1 ATP-binding cassette domain-containing protein [Gemella haemolysans]VEI39302.1 Glutathione import ATP-binding protein GsiA [Gemella haemolysans]
MSKEYLKLKNVRKVYKSKGMGKEVKETIAVNDISLDIYKAETLAVVGESGSGKTTLGKGILNIDPFTSGEVFVEGNEKSLTKMSKKELAEVYSKMQIIFQDPYSSLNPRMSALDIVMEALHKEDKETAKKKALEILEFVGISNEDALKLSNAFSGGQRQRIGIARAVVTRPDFILCDEPTSALDASTQAQVINLLKDLQEKFSLTYLFISHNLGVVEYIADRIAVMYRGNLVELGTTAQIMKNPQHVYTKRLLSSMPIIDPIRARQMFEEFEVSAEEIVITGSEKFEEVEEGHFVLK